MDNQVKPLSQEADAQSSSIALVLQTCQGEAIKITDLQGDEIPLRGHLSDVPWLEKGDEVVVTDTSDGAIISGRLRRVGELPQSTISVSDDAMLLIADRPLRIKVGESQLELTPNGQIRVDGREISQFAGESMRLLSPVIEVN
jgi:hypothetical protein